MRHGGGKRDLYRGAKIGVSEARTAQLQPGGDALEEYAALPHRQAARRPS
jgi:hypothetical protein